MTMEERYAEAIRKLGGAGGLLALPEKVKEALRTYTDLDTKTEMLEMAAAFYGGKE